MILISIVFYIVCYVYVILAIIIIIKLLLLLVLVVVVVDNHIVLCLFVNDSMISGRRKHGAPQQNCVLWPFLQPLPVQQSSVSYPQNPPRN
jgi:hypothetical protein